jgi:hypothetical protein
MNCGACGRTCLIPNATAGCSNGECIIDACPEGFVDVDGELANGCESREGSGGGDPEPLMCMEGAAELCNAFDDNCDGQCDEGRDAGCRQGIHRSSGNGHLFTDDLSAAQAAPYHLEAQDYFRTYAAPGVGLVPVHLCLKSNGKYLLSTSNDCEGLGTISRELGYWSSEAACGAVPLYRLYHAPSNNHFYTLSQAEANNATGNLGYVSQGIAGYVWTAP